MLQDAAKKGRAFYLNSPVIDARTSFILETLRVRPVGLIFQIEPYAAGEVTPPELTRAQSDRIVAEWAGRNEQLARVTNAAGAKILNGQLAAMLYSRAANANGVSPRRPSCSRIVSAVVGCLCARASGPGQVTLAVELASPDSSKVNAAPIDPLSVADTGERRTMRSCE